MTESAPNTSAERNALPTESQQSLGAIAIGSGAHETIQELSLADLVRGDSEHIYDEFIPFARVRKFESEAAIQKARQQNRKIDFELERQLMMPKIVYDFIRKKTEDFIEKRGQHPILSEVRGILPEKMVTNNLRQLHADRAKGRKHNTGAYLAKHEAYLKIAKDLEEQYPEILFAAALHDSFEDNNDPKYAGYASDIINATGRTIRILGRASVSSDNLRQQA